MATKQRSPRYPSLSLTEALEKARQIYAVEHTHPAPREVVVKDVGYTSLNGASLTLLGTLIRYGLLESQEDGVRVSEDAVTIFELPESDPDRKAALKRSAFKPELFAELFEQFGDRLPSEANLRHSLIKRGFLPKAADEVIRVYRENLQLVGTQDKEYNEGVQTSIAEGRDVDHGEQVRTGTQSGLPVGAPGTPRSNRQDVFSLAEGQVMIQWPAQLSKESYEDLSDWLEILKRKIGRSVVATSKENA